MSLSNRIKSRRDTLHMSQKQLATQLGYQPECGTIYKLETGKTKLPVDKLCKLAEVLETTPNWLLGWGGGENVEISTSTAVPEHASAATLTVHPSDDPTSEAVGTTLNNPLYRGIDLYTFPLTCWRLNPPATVYPLL